MMKERLRLSYLLTLCLVFTLVVGAPLMGSAALENTEEWVKRYNSPSNGVDEANAIAIDSLGNVYVTGESDGDYATVKYAPDGTELWVEAKRYDNGDDEAYAIAIDSLGNVYVTGRSDGSGTGRDYATIKYASDGTQLWVKRYDGPGNGDDVAYAIAVDASGVYVTGKSIGSETGYDYATVKYAPDGTELWVEAKRYSSPGNSPDEAYAIAVGTSGSVYVTGVSYGLSETGYDYATVKYNANGDQVWDKRYSGPIDDYNEATAIAVDASLGNVYVTGGSYGGDEEGEDYATVKYDTNNGNELWAKRYTGPGEDSDWAYAIAVDAAGNVYVTGESYGGSETDVDYATVKYDTDGNRLWVAQYNSPGNGVDKARAMAIDESGVYVTGRSDGHGTGYDYGTVKYDTNNGDELWVARYNSPGDGVDQASAIAVDESGNVYVTGRSDGHGTGYDYVTVKYGEPGEVVKEMVLPAGWSMISLPVRPAVATVGTVFPEAVVMYKYQRDMGYVRVLPEENLEVGLGYWILVDNPQSYEIAGTAITEYTTSVEDGWYMIGGCTSPAQTMVTSGNIDVIYEYTQSMGYTPLLGSPLELERGKGYWILFSNTSEGTAFTAKEGN